MISMIFPSEFLGVYRKSVANLKIILYKHMWNYVPALLKTFPWLPMTFGRKFSLHHASRFPYGWPLLEPVASLPSLMGSGHHGLLDIPASSLEPVHSPSPCQKRSSPRWLTLHLWLVPSFGLCSDVSPPQRGPPWTPVMGWIMSSQNSYWSPSPQHLRMWLYSPIRPLKRWLS